MKTPEASIQVSSNIQRGNRTKPQRMSLQLLDYGTQPCTNTGCATQTAHTVCQDKAESPTYMFELSSRTEKEDTFHPTDLTGTHRVERSDSPIHTTDPASASTTGQKSTTSLLVNDNVPTNAINMPAPPNSSRNKNGATGAHRKNRSARKALLQNHLAEQ